ncbi:DNA polymerase III subunit delta' [uncultured Azohydromonas sp.]|uniref:DNA polymerase III subunit delta' n=1 Tax=uncultured Azohydromonas sp. TaxID=487342 RepID=UPI00262C923B|nr:DNA polymerase III subunit delta' [uncultured Azohydromonas sp.]
MSAPLPWLEGPLQQALRQRAHALLIHGPAGVGQYEFGFELARALLCEMAGDGTHRPCGRCTACHLMDTHGHPDFRLLLPEALREPLGWAEEEPRKKDAKPSKWIRIEEVRQAIDWTHQSVSRGVAKVLLIHPATAMQEASANALLKTLEEPSPQVRLLLTATDPELLLPTIRSRCQRLGLALPPRGQALEWLKERGLAQPQVLLDAAGGRPLEAVALAGEGIDAAAWTALPQRLRQGDATAVASWNLPRLLETLLKLCHDLMAQAAGGAPRYFPADALPPGATLAELANWSRELTQLSRHDEHPWNASLLAESLVAQAAALWPARAGSGRARVTTLGR